MALYEQRTGEHAANRVQPEPGSDLEKQLAGLADAGRDNWVRVEEPETEQGDDTPKRPTKSAGKDAWVAYAVSQGADAAEAEKATKDDLIQAYGG